MKNKILGVAGFITVLTTLIPSVALAYTPCDPFRDIDMDTQLCKAVRFVNDKGIFEGYSVTRDSAGRVLFKPDQYINRAEVLKVINETMREDNGFPFVITTKDFSDTKDMKGQWWYQYFRNLMNNGLINGYPDGTFRPTANITRAEFLKLFLSARDEVYRNSKISELEYNEKIHLWADTKASQWYTNYFAFANQHGLFADFKNCPSGSICPAQQINRGEIATMIYNYYQNVK